MIIYGTRGITKTTKEGNFHCPLCGEQKPYAHKRVQRFFTLYFIPLFPLNVVGEYVECSGCGRAYKTAVLERAEVA